MTSCKETLSALAKVLTIISRALPERHHHPVHPLVAAREYAEAGKLYAQHEQAIFDALNLLRQSDCPARRTEI